MHKQKWIHSALFDGIFILSPPFIALAISHMLPQGTDISIAWWVVLILCIDVSHVYSTLYRTYFDKTVIKKHSQLLKLIPILSFGAGVLIYSSDSLYFWRVLAYLAVFHFIRQQYGFVRLYSKDNTNKYEWIDTFCIYTSTVFPIIYWHLEGPRNFNWFVKFDFYYIHNATLEPLLYTIYIISILAYIIKEIVLFYKTNSINIPKNGVIVGTILSWYFGIIYFNSDLLFTLLNVVSHGIPYMALVWVWGNKLSLKKNSYEQFYLWIFKLKGVWIFISIILAFAYFEEGLWDYLVWNENENLFKPFHAIPEFDFSSHFSWIIPLLSVPQITHYILDGFIWKIKYDKFEWSELVLKKNKT